MTIIPITLEKNLSRNLIGWSVQDMKLERIVLKFQWTFNLFDLTHKLTAHKASNLSQEKLSLFEKFRRV